MTEELLSNSRFEEWSGGFPTVWSRISSTGTTYRRLQKVDPREHPQRRVFPTMMKRSEMDYIWSGGEDGLRLELSSTVVANSWILRNSAASAKGLSIVGGQRYALSVVSRNSVENNLLRCQVIGILTATETLWLTPDAEALDSDGNYLPGRGGFTWATSETNISWKMKSLWQQVGLQAVIPLGVDSLSVRFSNGSSGVQVIDLGEVSLLERSYKIGGTG